MADPNAGSMVLFKRFGPPPFKRDWEVGRVVSTFFATPSGKVVEPDFDHPEYEPWLMIVPCAPEGEQAPTSLSVPLHPNWIDPVVHGTDLPEEA
jgi:hypothetical protein